MKEKQTIDFITLKGQEIPVKICFLNQIDLKFYPENPRIYSIITSSEQEPDQDEIENIMLKRDHVKHLIQAIKSNGGLTDPIFVREDNHVVIEGNSRLAAYRALARQDPITWGKIKCRLLPKNIDEDMIFSLLGEYHIVGKQDWAPYEQAGYLYRRCTIHKSDPQQMADSLGISVKMVNHLIEVYKFMLTHNDNNPNKWSYYDEYIKKHAIKKVRKEHPELDEIIVKKIKSGEIDKAVELRDNLPKIIKGGKKVITTFISEKKSFTECVEKAVSTGADEHCYQKIKGFRNWFVEDEVTESLESMSAEVKKKTHFELNKIKHRIDHLEKKYFI